MAPGGGFLFCPRWTRRPAARATRLGLAVTRGLLLDLVATDDDAGVTSTAQAFANLVRRAGRPH